MNLETKWLEDFVALSNTRSFSASARQRHVTQPAFSRRIRSLEQAVGVTLVDRSTTPIDLTPQGQLFLVTARNIVEQLNESLGHLRGLAMANEALDVVAAHSLALSFFPQWISRLQKGLGELPTRLVAMNVGEAIHVLREGNCDLMLAYYDPYASMQLDGEVFPSFSIGSVKMIPVCQPDANGEPRFSLDGDASLPYLAYTQGAFLGRSVRMLLKNDPLRLRLRTVYETAMAEGLKAMVMQGVGMAWIPDFCLRQELKNGTVVRAGGEKWDVPLEIRLYRCSLVHKPGVEKLWRQMMKLPRDFLEA
ncbi:LysR family transcriptional regulator [Halomonas denitrificans]|uniref:LysR substrate-binding domain-containing protein n=1 Tax=Halomonas TaxID=2745 RepID=UPI001A8DA397|nr:MULTISPECIES: LysR substrate-binding domain-containing protein [Halomonas]MBN8411206.1 LysR family transcriptional regulator [Halomonas litopenaei]MED5294006.1 LysR substrate-binding domain-containing protein [Pseudomonadota bacterium]MBY5925828.1 LysR family transcriptional regulator [Halomonas sp. DP4Y7-2]MBY5927560.1 LysR family transcriptional regulator [Halomonas sp. DP8Y7-3]MBY5969648.1 LysR family transcriptional regulator [Halomonas denitrificans]